MCKHNLHCVLESNTPEKAHQGFPEGSLQLSVTKLNWIISYPIVMPLAANRHIGAIGGGGGGGGGKGGGGGGGGGGVGGEGGGEGGGAKN